MAFGDQDLGTFFQDGDLATAAGGTFMCHFDTPEQDQAFGQIGGRAQMNEGTPEIRFASASAPPGLAGGSVIEIKGVSWQLREDPRKEGDGKVSVAKLRKG